MKNIYAFIGDVNCIDHEFDLSDFDDDWEELLANETLNIELATTRPEEFKDFHSLAGSLGVVSDRLASLLLAWGGPRLKLRSVLVDGAKFQILLQGEPVDVLDRARSKYSMFKSDPTTIKQIDTFVFHSEILPRAPFIFTIPESPSTMFVTEEAAIILVEQKFTGIDLVHTSNYQE